jgi:hypothetical protein
MNLSDVETGCYIDGSHMSSFDFSAAVIEFAHDFGFELEWEAFLRDVEWMNGDETDDERLSDILDAIDWTYEDALDYLNTNTRPGFVWVVRDQSLYLMTYDEADDICRG